MVRFGGSHPMGHRDLLDRHVATIRKDILPGNPTLAEALNQGHSDIVRTWLTYRDEFVVREGLTEDAQ
jgi:hypothetical protein